MKKYLLAFILSTLVFGQNDFSLEDINPLSDTYEQLIGPSYFAGNMVVLGFFHEYWGSCRARFGLLNDIYLDLRSEDIEDVKIIGVGKDQYISSLDGMINGRVLPWVQDSSTSDYVVWSNFEANQRDIFFIGTDGQIDTSFNITPYNPSDPDDVIYIKELILSFRGNDNSSLSLKDEPIPESFTLYQNYPNPFNPLTTIKYNLNDNSYVNVAIYNVAGKLVKTLFNGNQNKGENSLIWNATNNENESMPGGLYIYSVNTENIIHFKKMILLK